MKLFALRAGFYSSMEGPEISSIWTTEEGVKAYILKLQAEDQHMRPVGEVFKKYQGIDTNTITDGDHYMYYQAIYADTEFMYNSPEEQAQWKKEWEKGQP